MSADPALMAAVLGGIVGLVLALSGAGGGIIAVPLLVFGLHLEMVAAAPIGLIAVGLAALVGAMLGLREGIVRYRAAALIGFVGMLAAPLGVWLAQRIPNPPLLFAFGLLLALTGWRSWQRAARDVRGEAPDPTVRHACEINPAEGRLRWTAPCARALAATGATSGLLSGLLGVGGGFVIVPALGRHTDLDHRSVLATSLAVIALVSVGGVSAAASHGHIALATAAPFAAGALAALLAGRQIGRRLQGPRLQQVFALVCGAVSLLMLARSTGVITFGSP